MLHIAGINYESIADAEGVCCTIFFSGCNHHCAGCHSPDTWDFEYGKEVDKFLIEEINSQIDKRPFLNGLVLSGGDPMYSASDICEFLDKVHIPNDNVWCYTGFTIEEIQDNENMLNLVKRCSCIIDGMFDIKERDVTLRFRGSRNQRMFRVNNNNGALQLNKEID